MATRSPTEMLRARRRPAADRFPCDKEYQTLWMDLEFQRRVQLQCLTVW